MNIFELKKILKKFNDTDTVCIDIDGKYYPLCEMRIEIPEPLSMWEEPAQLAIIALEEEYDNK